MAEKHGPDGNGVHQDYTIQAEKLAKLSWGEDCRDVATVRVHDLALAKRIVEFLRGLGFAVALERRTKAILDEDKFPDDDGADEEDEHGS